MLSSPWRTHRRFSRRCAAIVILALGAVFGIAAGARATQTVELSFEELVRGSSDIVVARVIARASRWGDDTRRWMVTDFDVEVEDRVAGAGPSTGRLTLRYWGGTIGGETQGIAGVELPTVGGTHLFMLRRGWAASISTPTTGVDQGLFRVERDTNGVNIVRGAGRRLVGRDGTGNPVMSAATTASSDAMTLADLVAWIRAVPPGPAPDFAAQARATAGDPRLIRTFRLTPEAPSTVAAARPASQAPRRPPSPSAAPPSPGERHEEATSGEPVSRAAELGEIAPQYSWVGPPNAPVVINQFPPAFAPWSPEDQYQMSKWNHLASDLFRVFVTPTGTYGWPNDRFDLAGWPSSADTQRVYGYTWGADTLGITFYRMTDRIIEADIALNPAFGWTLDDEWVYDGSTARSFRRTMFHELGHVFGLQHNFDFLSVMNYAPSAFRAYGIPFMDDAEGVRSAYASRVPARTDLGVYLFRSTGYQSWAETPLPSQVVAGDSFFVNNFHVENAGTNAIANPALDWYLTSSRSYSGTNLYLGTRTFFGTLGRFSYYTTDSVGTWLTVPATANGGLYYLNAYSPLSDGPSQSGFPFAHSRAWSRGRIKIYPAMGSLSGSVLEGGAAGSSTLSLRGRTDAGGLDVFVTSSAPGTLSVAPSHRVGAFSAAVVIPFTTAPVASRQQVTLTASSQGKSVSTVVVVLPRSAIEAKDVKGTIGQLTTLIARLRQVSSGQPIANATVRFRVAGDAGDYSAQTDETGTARFKYRIPAAGGVGARLVNAVFNGDADHAAASDDSTLTVDRAKVSISIGKAKGRPGAGVSLAATLKRATDKASIAGSALTFTAFGRTYAATTNALGKASVVIVVPAGTARGTYPVSVSFKGDAWHLPGTQSRDLTVE